MIKTYKSMRVLLYVFLLFYGAYLHAEEIPFTDRQDWPLTDFNQYTVPLSALVDSGLGKDGFASLDQPAFESTLQAQQWLPDTDPVIAVSIQNKVKAYPLRILIYHEMVNDYLAGRAIAITYCPLCNAAMVFSREHDQQILEFGISGKVYASNMIMYDRQTESWWLQFTGKGVVGRYAHQQLAMLPSQIVSFAQFKDAFPDGAVLSKNTGYGKKYGINPYVRYDSRQLPYQKFFPKPPSDRLPPLERVLGVEINGKSMIYPFSSLQEKTLLQNDFENIALVVIGLKGVASAVDARKISQSDKTLAIAAFSRMIDGQKLDFIYQRGEIVDMQTKSKWNLFGRAIEGPLMDRQLTQVDRGVYFSFVWLDFYPQSKIHVN